MKTSVIIFYDTVKQCHRKCQSYCGLLPTFVIEENIFLIRSENENTFSSIHVHWPPESTHASYAENQH